MAGAYLRREKKLVMLLLVDIVISIADIIFLALLLFIIHFLYGKYTGQISFPSFLPGMIGS